MAWIESHQSLGGHIKLRRLARALNIPKAQAIGHLHYLWWWALDGAPDGDISTLSDDEIAELSDWTGDSCAFLNALVDCGWIDQDRKIHDWNEYAGKLLEFRRRDRERKRDARRNSNGNPSDVHGTSVVPYRTVPTVPNQPTVPTQPSCVELPKEFPKTEAEAIKCSLGKQPDDFVIKTWNLAMSRNGLDHKGRLITSWQHYLQHAWICEQDRKAGGNGSSPASQVRSLSEIISQKQRELDGETDTAVRKQLKSEIESLEEKKDELNRKIAGV